MIVCSHLFGNRAFKTFSACDPFLPEKFLYGPGYIDTG